MLMKAHLLKHVALGPIHALVDRRLGLTLWIANFIC
jgi:hypothetical protein